MNYYFRRIKSLDIDSIWSLIERLKAEKAEMSFTDYTSKEDIMNLVDNPSQLTYAAVTKEEPFRVLCLVKGRRKMSIERSHCVFLSAATHPDARGSGLAANLTNFALNQMKNEGVTIARIYVYSNNKASINAIKKLDFVHAGTVLRHYMDPLTGDYVDDLIFHKILDD
ncbi:GNAT family N-acetyltransferase [Haloplasma contractile]|uniref:Mycothiol acetyltransferase protein n=1 Tax=Haloplasma contractile SSD-17B TaxID=1033810 RepID=U2FJD5_9MOLU|nr:GNAT family N-acetyltransferase [Haloplasma contractile]ERJ11379.1 Mycothiol acetyltransferase protein [Haloplasma contractile SSD-17B]